MFRFSLLLAAMVMTPCVGPLAADDVLTNSAIRTEMEAMLESDQRYRSEIQSLEGKLGATDPEVQALREKQARADQANVKRLVAFVESRGWPGQSELGEKAVTAAFLVLQHADLALQLKFLPLLREAAAKHELKPSRLAMLEDRIAVRTGKPQIYGTQLARDPKTGFLDFSPIADEANVDKRRESVGLEPIAEYAKGFGLVHSRLKTD